MSAPAEPVKKTFKANELKGKAVSVCGEGGEKTRTFVRDAGAQITAGGQPRSSNAFIFVHQLKRNSDLFRLITTLVGKKCVVLMNCKVSDDHKTIQGIVFDEAAYDDFRELTPKEKEAQRKQEELDELEKSMTYEERNHDGVAAILKVSDVPSRLVALETLLTALRNPSPKAPSAPVELFTPPPEKRLRLDDSVPNRVTQGQRLEVAARFASSLQSLSTQATLSGLDEAIISAADKRDALKPDILAKETEIGRIQAAQKQYKEQLDTFTKKSAALRADYLKVAVNQGDKKLPKDQMEAKLAEIDRERTAADQSVNTLQARGGGRPVQGGG
eukprot:TRINITY_DN19850_c0_g1_i6.p2 TRINITY_DN19850_c0_g1~~TRINITY_DN19850_c0_g1_i6.p2  ORF type:complete len:355 (+),score=131.63 TRINITY_DN19850_c0_g1_i6:78-1067(+)